MVFFADGEGGKAVRGAKEKGGKVSSSLYPEDLQGRRIRESRRKENDEVTSREVTVTDATASQLLSTCFDSRSNSSG